MKTNIIGIAGGSGSGKTYITNQIIKKFGEKKISIIELDSYYKDLSHLPFDKRKINNFDHPNSFDFKLLINDLDKLEKNNYVNIPTYDYKTHTRMKTKKLINKNMLIIIEGIFSLYNKNIRDKMSLKVFLDESEKIRLDRRLKRDIIDRDRTVKSINNQYKKTVIPMHKKFVEPTKAYADLIIEDSSKKTLFNKIENILNG